MAFPKSAFKGMLETCTILRASIAGAFAKGRYTKPIKAEIPVQIVVQPIDFGTMLKSDPQADATMKHYKLRSAQEIKHDDHITIRGEICKIVSVKDWLKHGGHWSALASTTVVAPDVITVTQVFDDTFDETFA